MDLGDTAKFQLTVSNSTKTIDVELGSIFSGKLEQIL